MLGNEDTRMTEQEAVLKDVQTHLVLLIKKPEVEVGETVQCIRVFATQA